MARSRGILSRILSCTLGVLLLGLCTGCNFRTFTDYIRPDLNLNEGVRLFVAEVPKEGEEDASVQPGEQASFASSVWSGGSPNTGSLRYKNPNRTVDTQKFAATEKDMLTATDYGRYLEECVYRDLLEAIEPLSQDVKDKLYIRIGHIGINLINGQVKKGISCPGVVVGGTIRKNKTVGGDSLISFAEDWVGGLSINASARESQQNNAKREVSNYISEKDFGKNWYELSNSGLPQTYYKLFGRDHGNFKTFGEYYKAIDQNPWNNIPNYSLLYYTGTNSTNKITFNRVSNSAAESYIEGMPTDTVDKLFSTYNQYTNRSRQSVTKVVTTDRDSLLKYYLDGYNKTIIFVGTVSGGDLKSVVGSSVYEKLSDIVTNAYTCTDVSNIKKLSRTITTSSGEKEKTDYKNFTVIPAGSKGVD